MPKFTFVTATARNHQSPHGRPASTLSPVKYYGGRIGNPLDPAPRGLGCVGGSFGIPPARSSLAGRGRAAAAPPPAPFSCPSHAPPCAPPPRPAPARPSPHMPTPPPALRSPRAPCPAPCFPPTPRAPARRARPSFGRPRGRAGPRSLLWWLLGSSLADCPRARDAPRAADEWALAGRSAFALPSLWVRSAFALPWHGGFGFQHPADGGSDGRRRHWFWCAPAIAGVLNFC